MKDKYIDQYGIDSLPHLIDASKFGMEMFITVNKGMLDDREELEKKYNIKIRSPEDFDEEELDEEE